MAAAAAIPPHCNIAAAGKDQGDRTGPKVGAEKQKAAQNRQRNVHVIPLEIISREKGWSLCPKHELLHSKPPRLTWK